MESGESRYKTPPPHTHTHTLSSSVWKYFGISKSNDKKATRKTCDAEVAYMDGTTQYLSNHENRHHSIAYRASCVIFYHFNERWTNERNINSRFTAFLIGNTAEKRTIRNTSPCVRGIPNGSFLLLDRNIAINVDLILYVNGAWTQKEVTIYATASVYRLTLDISF